MDESSSDENLDEFCSSYSTFAKKTYEVALERASKATVGEEGEKSLDVSTDFPDVDPEDEKLPHDISSSNSSSDSECKRPRRKVAGRRGRPVNRKRRGKKSSKLTDEEGCVACSSGDESVDSLIESVKNNISQHPDLSPIIVIGEKCSRNTRKRVTQETVTIVSSDEDKKSPEIKKRPCIESNDLMSIKICWKYSEPIQKFQLRRYQKFQSILDHFAKLEGVTLEQVVLYGGKDNMRLIEPYDTPDSIGYTITDILEGGTLSKESVKQSGIAKRYRDPSATDGEEIELRLQLEQIRSFPLTIRKEQKMKILLVKVAEQLETEVDKIKLLLDGEVIDLESTPQDLDLEDGDVLDVLLTKPPGKLIKSPVKSDKSPRPGSTKRPRRRCRK